MSSVFISHSTTDSRFVSALTKRLTSDGISVQIFSQITAGENIKKVIEELISTSQYFIVVLSQRSVSSEWVNFEISATLINEVSQERNIILPVLLEDCEIPFSLKDRFYADFRSSFDEGYSRLIGAIKNKQTKVLKAAKRKTKTFNATDYEVQLKSIKEAHSNGNLALFCGAGVSYDAKIPTWNALLRSLLREVYSGKLKIPNIDKKLANLFEKRINVSPLILAQYLKIYLGKSFTGKIRDALYLEALETSKTIDSVVELSRPKRERKPLRAIITFNFDDLIEDNLLREKIEFKSIYSEGERHLSNQIPIYHPHGCLPRRKKLDSSNEIVFSEDAYHTQFSDSFSWSNLVQLNHLNNFTCLFAGISLSDPNMRRLLDVSMRKNGKGEKNHYIIKKRYTMEDLYQDQHANNDSKVIPVLENIEELDANNLGFNVIWITEFSQLPDVLLEIANNA